MLDEQNPTSGDGAQAGEPADLTPDMLELLVEQDPEALAAFFDAYFGRVYGYVRRLVHDEHLTEDLTQDIFLHLHRALPTYDPARDLRPWVFTIATNKVRDYWRSKRHREAQKESSIERDSAADQVSAGEHRPDSDLAGRELDAKVQEAVEALPESMRVAVQLRVYENLSFEVIGEILDRNEVAVRKRYSRALETLRTTLGTAWRTHAGGT